MVDVPDEPLRARSTEVPDEHALQGFHAVYAAVADARSSSALLSDVMGAVDRGEGRSRCAATGAAASIHFEAARAAASAAPARSTTSPGRRVRRARRLARAGAGAGFQITPVIDRFYFRSVYFREPGGILYELASIGPGFTTDEPPESLGERLALPPDFERLRAQVEPVLTPLPDIRQWRPAPVA